MGSMRLQVATADRDAAAEAMNSASQQVSPRAGHAPPASDMPTNETMGQRRRILTRTVEFDVIPRLLLRQRAHPGESARSDAPALIRAPDVAELVGMVLGREEPDAYGFIEAVHRQGASPEAILLELLAPAARRLGVLWELDECDFTSVTIGLWRLQSAMAEFRPVFVGKPGLSSGAPRALLVPLPGDQHGFGLAMVFDFFCRAGWDAWTGSIGSSAELAGMVRHQWTDVIGFTLACDDGLDRLAAEIRSVRRASCNPGIGVLVGGPAFSRSPHLVTVVGADATAADGRQAVLQARTLLDFQPKRPGTFMR